MIASRGRQLVGVVRAVLILAMVSQVVANGRFVAESAERPAYAERMTIDSATYVSNARAMLAAGSALVTPDAYHSAGMSVYVATVFRLFGDRVGAVKWLNVLWWVGSLLALFAVARAAFGDVTAALFVTWAASASNLLQKYCAVVQYEIPALVAVTAVLWIGTCRRGERGWQLTAGVLLAALATLRLHYAGFFMVYVGALALGAFRAPSAAEGAVRLRDVGWAAASFVVLALAWNLTYSVSRGETFCFQAPLGGFWRRLHANNTGVTWPYPAQAEPHGLAFIATQPHLYIALLTRRAVYLFGFEPDVWHVPSTAAWVLRAFTGLPAPVARWMSAAGLATAVGAGLVHAAGWLRARPGIATPDAAAERRRFVALCCAGNLLVILLPQLLAGSSTRFWVPVFPCVFLLAGLVMRRRWLEARQKYI